MNGTEHSTSVETGQREELQHRLDQAADRMIDTRRQFGEMAARYEEGVMIGLAQALNVVTGAPVHETVRLAVGDAHVPRRVGLRRGSDSAFGTAGTAQAGFKTP
jgi:hypothetical protein